MLLDLKFSVCCFNDRSLSFCSLCCLFFFDLRILITCLVSSKSSCDYDKWAIILVIWNNNFKSRYDDYLIKETNHIVLVINT